MKDGIPGWIQWVDVAVGFALDMGMGLAEPSSAIEKGAATVFTLAQTITNEGLDRA